jgi:hypothetical protein
LLTRGFNLFDISICGKGGNESFLRNFHATNHLHALLSLFLLFKKLALSGNIATITFSQNIFTDRADALARDDA